VKHLVRWGYLCKSPYFNQKRQVRRGVEQSFN